MIVVTGATGKLGSAVVESLLGRVPASEIGVSVRDASKASALADKGVRVREASFDDPQGMEKAFEGADVALVISTDIMGAKNVQRCTDAIDAAVRAGAGRVVYTSHMGCSHDSDFQACVDHAQVEDHLDTCGVAWTALRNGFYASSALEFARYGFQSGDIAVPADGKVSWTAHADLADAAAAILTGQATFDGPTPPLTSYQAADFSDIAAAGTEATGRTVTRTVIADEVFVQQIIGYGTPEVVARQLLGIFVAARNGEFSAVDPTMGKLIGRTPKSVYDLIRGVD